ncbi:MAG TPA: dihydrodipicolinate synthase family protein [Arenicellales bacterium]|nr:dihydrodipicolinate synthase family protein [Arenicellales bacterium]
MKGLTGVCVPVCTVFDDTGTKVDEPRYLAHIDRMLESGVDIILPCGGTGEFAYLSTPEKRRLVEITGKHIQGRAAMVAQTSGIYLEDTLSATRHAIDHGADAVMVLPPYFEGPDERGVISHYEAVAKASSAPVMVYNIPVHSGFDVTPALFAKLLEVDGIEYIKDSTGDLIRIQELLHTGGKIFNGGDPITYPALVAGCVGCVWGSVNFLPDEAVALFKMVKEGDLNAAANLWEKLISSQLFVWSHVYNAAVKAAASYRGFDLGHCRAPVLPLDSGELKELHATLSDLP